MQSKRAKRQDRVCPPYNICGDGVCQVTTHPSFQYAYVCRCNDGTYKFEPCSTTSTGSSTCTTTSCLNGATCVPYSATERWCNSLQVGKTCCQCIPGYTGLRCETDIDECSSNPCKNNGVCDNLVNSYRCRCPTGFSGTNCEIATSVVSGACALRPCGNFPCLESPNFPTGYICQCGVNDFRPSCTATTASTTPSTTTRITTTSSLTSLCPDQSICKNQGICYITSGTLRCVCPQGFTGTFCETATTTTTNNGCNPNPCRNSGNCVTDVAGKFIGCICPSGYTGTFCEVVSGTSGACGSITCQNNGICQTNSAGTAVCTCPAGTTGTRCETVFFRCTKDGRFKDQYGCAAGKYIECVYVGQTQVGLPNGIAYSRECPTSLRYNPAIDQCDYAVNVQC